MVLFFISREIMFWLKGIFPFEFDNELPKFQYVPLEIKLV
jgi:hypothetical protein